MDGCYVNIILGIIIIRKKATRFWDTNPTVISFFSGVFKFSHANSKFKSVNRLWAGSLGDITETRHWGLVFVSMCVCVWHTSVIQANFHFKQTPRERRQTCPGHTRNFNGHRRIHQTKTTNPVNTDFSCNIREIKENIMMFCAHADISVCSSTLFACRSMKQHMRHSAACVFSVCPLMRFRTH